MFTLMARGSTLVIRCGDRLYSSESDVYRRQILMTKVDPRAAGAKINIILKFNVYKLNLQLLFVC